MWQTKKYSILMLFLFNIACSQSRPGLDEKRIFVVKDSLEQSQKFEQWLNEHGLSLREIVDTTVKVPYGGLWSYSRQVDSVDSLSYWYPSRDSSYYFVTNYKNGDSISAISKIGDDPVLNLDFFETQRNLIFPVLKDWVNHNVYHYWMSSNSMFYLQPESNRSVSWLTRFDMGSDTIWYYHFDIDNLPLFTNSQSQR